MIFIDTSYYLSLLNDQDSNHDRAVGLVNQMDGEKNIVSVAVLGEMLTVGSQRFSRQAVVDYVDEVMKDKDIQKVFENEVIVDLGLKFFKSISQKNIGWVDCYSFAIIDYYKIGKVLSFDKHFRKYINRVVDHDVVVID